MDLSELILHDGGETRATGQVIVYMGDVWFDPPLPIPLVAYAPGHEPPPRPSGLGVLTNGVDLDRLQFRIERDGVVAGLATLTGIWRGDRLEVTEQSGESRDANPWRPFWRTPPCPPPPHGWPQVPEGSNIEPSPPVEPSPPESIPGRVSVVLFRPTPTQVVLVVATSQPEGAEALLRPIYGDALCVVAGRWTPDQVEVVRHALHEHWEEWGVYEMGDQAGDDAQVIVCAKLVRVLPGIAEWCLTLPYGIVEVAPWLGSQVATWVSASSECTQAGHGRRSPTVSPGRNDKTSRPSSSLPSALGA